ncbi:VOC family protein [Cognatishimia sp.]|uniref:VOC family protein n=1 Tax=Cognatishimia sp. TaxID=2211648 RepID=UPI003511AAFB
MISYVTIGSNDIPRSKRFFAAFLPALGYQFSEGADGLSYTYPVPDGLPLQPDFYVKPPFNGQSATNGNGAMVAFEASSQAEVRRLHAAACEAGGTDDGAPGFRPDYGASFFVGYLRDPDGNKIALFSSNPNDPSRDDPPAA